jgi:large repetitive protein
LLDAIKPLLGVVGGPGEWQLAPGIAIAASGTGGDLTLGVGIDTSAFTSAGAGQLTAGATAALVFASGAPPRPAIDVFAGLAGAPAGRSAVHLSVDGGVRLFLRPGTGADIPLVPPGPGLGGLVQQAVTRALPLLLDALSGQTEPGLRQDAGRLVATVGDALGLRTGPDDARVFDPAALEEFGRNPAASLITALPNLTAVVLEAIADALGPALPDDTSATVVDGALHVTVGATTVVLDLDPFAVTVAATVPGIPVLDSVTVTITLGAAGLGALVVRVGPAVIDAGGTTLRPVITAAVGAAPPGGRRIEAGLATGDDTELNARWLLDTARFDLVFTDGGVDHTDPVQVALGLLEAVLDLVASYVMSTAAVAELLDRPVGASTVRDVLAGVVLKADDPDELDDDLFDPARLLTRLKQLALNLATASPSVEVGGGLVVGVRNEAGLLGVTLGLTGRVEVVPGDVTISLEADSRWITPAPPSGGIVLNLVTAPGGNAALTFTPGLAVNGVGVRIARSDGPLLDSVVRIDSLALHLYGEVGGGRPLSGGAQLQLAGLAVAVGGAQGGNPVAQGVMGDAGSGDSALAPTFSPSLAVQKHGSGPVLVSLRAGDGAGPWWLAIQQGFGPLYIEQVGFGVTVEQDQIQQISLLFDGRVSIFGLTAAVDDLSLTYLVSAGRSLFDPASWAVDLAGLAISSDLGGVLLQGGLRKFGTGEDVQYVGMLFARFGVYGLSVFGGYGQSGPPGDRFTSFFAFGAINGPIGGPPAFFVTGIGGGIGINRSLIIPADLSEFGAYPLIKALDPGAKPSPDPMTDLTEIGALFPVARDQFWFAAGVSFTSFALVDGVVVVSIAVGDGLQIALLGLARLALPRPQFPLVSIELGLVARFSTKEAVLWVQAQLTDNSWLLYEEIRLTGGFAFVAWYGGPNAGQFVLTMGGYHPSFHRDGYPDVPRLGLQWRVGPYLSIKGESYFALTSEAVMAGGRLEASATFGPAWASLVLGADAIIYFDPFFMNITVYAQISAGITIDIWIGEITISISIGARVTLVGPKFHGAATFEVGPAELTVEFGEQDAPQPAPIGWADFVRKYLEEAEAGIARAVTAIPGRGAIPPGAGPGGATDTGTADGSAGHPFEVICEFEITVTTTVPTRTFVVGGETIDAEPSLRLGIAPMNVADAASRLVLRLDNVTSFADAPAGTDHLGRLSRVIRETGAFPAGVWGQPQPADDPKVPAGEVILAAEGATFTAAAEIEAGSVPIEYRQVKVRDRLPLPFVNSRTARPRVLADAAVLHDLVPVVGSQAELLDVSKTWLGNAGYGATTLAAYAGDRAAPPILGTLGEGLTGPEVEATPAYPATTGPIPVDTRVHPPRAIAVLTAALDSPEAAALRTTVADRDLPRQAPPTVERVRAGAELAWPARLTLVAPRAGTDRRTLFARGEPTLTRQARTGAEAGAVRGAAVDGAVRLRGLSDALAGGGKRVAVAAPDTVQAGEIAVLRLPNAVRDVSAHRTRPVLTLAGTPARTVVLGHGGDVLADTGEPKVEMPRGAERIVVAALGQEAGAPAQLSGLAGWHAGMSVGYTGWSAALAPGAIMRCQGKYGRRGLARVRAGWVPAAELVAGTGLVETRFAAPVDVVVVAIDDPGAVAVDPGGRGGRGLSVGLAGARRARGADGTEQPPIVVVNQGRGYAVYAVEPLPGKAVVVSVASEDGWHLVGVLGGRGTVREVADRLAAAGLGDLIRPFTTGLGGSVRLGWTEG